MWAVPEGQDFTLEKRVKEQEDVESLAYMYQDHQKVHVVKFSFFHHFSLYSLSPSLLFLSISLPVNWLVLWQIKQRRPKETKKNGLSWKQQKERHAHKTKKVRI